jgi:cellulose synthase/poly-beta-1,6-N-acetylglucosamine synthase-like glycosyltransferase
MKKKGNLRFLIIVVLIVLIIYFILGWFWGNNQKNKEKFEIERNEIENPSFHVLIATIGRDTIFNMLESLKQQLNKEDYLTIVFDGPNSSNVDKVRSFVSDMKCNTNVIVEKEKLGFYGHAIRNKHNQLSGDFVFHVDDDDNIMPDCMEALRETCKDKNTVYIFKIIVDGGRVVWETKNLVLGEVGTPSGAIPAHLNSTSEFTHINGGDYEFYKKLEQNGNHLKYIDKVIYIVRPHNYINQI